MVEGHAFIQWKGTDVCIDVTCPCGAGFHFDGYFLYAYRCPVCGHVYRLGTEVTLTLDDNPDGVVQDIPLDEVD